MTDHELFALATKINRIECSMTSFHSFINDEEVRRPILARMYADLVPLRAQLDAALGLGNADIADNLPQRIGHESYLWHHVPTLAPPPSIILQLLIRAEREGEQLEAV